MENSSPPVPNFVTNSPSASNDSDLDEFDVIETETFDTLRQSLQHSHSSSQSHSHSQPQSKSQPSSAFAVLDDEIVNSLTAASISEQAAATERNDDCMVISQNASTISGSDEVYSDLKKVIEENAMLKNEVESLNSKLKEVVSQFETLGKKITQGQEDKKKLEQCSLSLAKLTEEHDALKVHFEASKMQIIDLENQLQAARHAFQDQADTLRVNEAQSGKLEIMESHLRFKEEQLEQTKKQLAEIAELYQLEQNQTIDLKEKLRAAECKPISSQVESQLFSFTAEDIVKVEQDLANCKAIVNRQNADLLEKDDKIQMIQAQLNSSQVALDEQVKMAAAKQVETSNYISKMVSEKQEEVLQLQQLLASCESNCNYLQIQLNEKDKLNASFAGLLKEKDFALQELSLAKEKCEEICLKYQARIKELKQELAELKPLLELHLQRDDENQHIQALRNEVTQFKLAAHELDRENTTLKTQIAALTTENDSIAHWKAQCETYNADYLQVLSQRDALDAQIAELNKAIEDLQEQDKKKQDELEELHSTHIRFAQEHINSQEPTSVASTTSATTSAKGRGINGSDGGGKNEDIVSHVINQLKRGVSLLWENENEPVSNHSSLSSNSNQPDPSAPPSADPQPSTSSRGMAAAGSSSTDLPPCPVCGKIFYDYELLVEHCENCGESVASNASPSNYGQHLDPFVFVPNQ